MTVRAVTPHDGARHPSHPDHARWVKEQTIKREIEHARSTGGTLRDAEAANARSLERLDNRKRIKKPRAKPKKRETAKREVTSADLLAAGVTKKIAPVQAAPASPCNWCGLCRRCKREARLRVIMTKAREGDPLALSLVWELTAMGFAAQKRTDYRDSLNRELPFSRLRGHDRNRAITLGAEWVCERSTPILGAWF